MRTLTLFAVFVLLLSAAAPARAESSAIAAEAGSAEKARIFQKKLELASTLHYQTGQITLRDDLAKLAVPADYRFLGPQDARKVLVDLWHNPPAKELPLGMLLPKDLGPLDSGCWAVIIKWSEEGYVKDDDADKIDYAEMLTNLKKSAHEANPERLKNGYLPIEIIGWAMPPRYDRATHKLYWAKELQFGDDPDHTLNYDIRILGRRGVLVLQAVADMTQIKTVTAATPELLAMVDFNQGHRYVDFDPSTDKVAAYGLAALVAGGIAAKVGLLKGAWIFILAAKKFVIMGIIALVAIGRKYYGRIFGRLKPSNAPSDAPPPPPPQ